MQVFLRKDSILYRDSPVNAQCFIYQLYAAFAFRRGTMQMYQIREANSGGKSKKVVVYIIQKGLNHYIPIIYKIITQLKK